MNVIMDENALLALAPGAYEVRVIGFDPATGGVGSFSDAVAPIIEGTA